MKLKDNYGYKKTIKSIVEYIITNRLFISYVVLSLIATICVRAFTIGSALKLKPLLTDLGFILVIGGLGYLVKPKNQFKYYFTWLIIFNLICLILKGKTIPPTLKKSILGDSRASLFWAIFDIFGISI